MHVCHLAKYYPPAAGGIETHVQALARAQCDAGAEATVLCINHRTLNGNDSALQAFDSGNCSEETDEGVRVLRVKRRLTLSKWDYAPGLARLIERIQGTPRKVDLFHLHAPNPTMALAFLFARIETPLIVTHHSDIVRQRFLGRVFAIFERRLLRRARLILTDSPPYADGSESLRNFRNKVEDLPLGIDLDLFLTPTPKALAFRDRLRSIYPGPLWLCVGRLVYYKGLSNALLALRSLPGTLLIVGEGPLRAELELQAASCGVSERVVWLGKADADELVGAYHAAAALLFPSNARSEAFGLVQVEAMASGCPVINTTIPHSGVSWVSMHEVSGLTVAVDSPSELCTAARRLLDEPHLRSRLSTAARDRAERLFGARQMAQKSLEIYQRVLSH